MALSKTDAVVLKAYNWSESSRTVIFFTREFGKIALYDKGGRSIKSKRGRIVDFAEMQLTFYNSEKETNGYVSDIELIKQYPFDKDGSLGRLAYGSAGAEILRLLLPEEEPQRQLYQYYLNYLQLIDSVEKQFTPALFLAFFLRILSQLGYHPSISYCILCSKEIQNTGAEINFAADIGGVICDTCQKPGEYYISLSAESFKLLKALQTASLAEAATVPLGMTQVTILQEALSRFASSSTSIEIKLKSLAFIEKLKNK